MSKRLNSDYKNLQISERKLNTNIQTIHTSSIKSNEEESSSSTVSSSSSCESSKSPPLISDSIEKPIIKKLKRHSYCPVSQCNCDWSQFMVKHLAPRRPKKYDSKIFTDFNKAVLISIILEYSVETKDQWSIVRSNQLAKQSPTPLIRRQLCIGLQLMQQYFYEKTDLKIASITFRKLLESVKYKKWTRLKKRAPLSQVVCTQCYNFTSLLQSIGSNFNEFKTFIVVDNNLDIESLQNINDPDLRNTQTKLRLYEFKTTQFLKSKLMLLMKKDYVKDFKIRTKTLEFDNTLGRDVSKIIHLSVHDFVDLFMVRLFGTNNLQQQKNH